MSGISAASDTVHSESRGQTRVGPQALGSDESQAQVLEDASDDCRILDSSAMTRIGPLHLGQKV